MTRREKVSHHEKYGNVSHSATGHMSQNPFLIRENLFSRKQVFHYATQMESNKGAAAVFVIFMYVELWNQLWQSDNMKT